MKILLAEDEHELSRALTAVLEHSDYKVTAVYNGEDAVAEAKKSAYDCFIFDIISIFFDYSNVFSDHCC